MNEDERAQMFLDECLHNAGLKEDSPFKEEDESKDESKDESTDRYNEIPERY